MVKKILGLLIVFLYVTSVKAGGVEDFCALYREMPSNYIKNISVRDVAEVLLSNLNVLDSEIKMGVKGRGITIYYKNKHWIFSKPENDKDVNAWCKLSEQVVLKAAEFSEKFSNNDFMLSESVLTKALPMFDKDSKFFSDTLESGSKRLKNRRLFVARDEGNGELFVKIGIFNKYTTENLMQLRDKFDNVENIVIDLRGNAGGSLKTAIEAADLFLDAGIIVSTKGRDEKEVFYNADEKEIFKGANILILVDKQTASSAEMFAKTLEEQGRAKIEGGQTYGKKTLQNLIDLPSGGVAAVTEAYFRLPSEI